MKPLALAVALVASVCPVLAQEAAGPAGKERSSPAPTVEQVPAAAGQGDEPGLLNRIDFGNAYVMGQSIKSGAVYLLNRKKSEIPSMLQKRKDFRREIREDAETLEGGAR